MNMDQIHFSLIFIIAFDLVLEFFIHFFFFSKHGIECHMLHESLESYTSTGFFISALQELPNKRIFLTLNKCRTKRYTLESTVPYNILSIYLELIV